MGSIGLYVLLVNMVDLVCMIVCRFMVRLGKDRDIVTWGENKCPEPATDCSAGSNGLKAVIKLQKPPAECVWASFPTGGYF